MVLSFDQLLKVSDKFDAFEGSINKFDAFEASINLPPGPGRKQRAPSSRTKVLHNQQRTGTGSPSEESAMLNGSGVQDQFDRGRRRDKQGGRNKSTKMVKSPSSSLSQREDPPGTPPIPPTRCDPPSSQPIPRPSAGRDDEDRVPPSPTPTKGRQFASTPIVSSPAATTTPLEHANFASWKRELDALFANSRPNTTTRSKNNNKAKSVLPPSTMVEWKQIAPTRSSSIKLTKKSMAQKKSSSLSHESKKRQHEKRKARKQSSSSSNWFGSGGESFASTLNLLMLMDDDDDDDDDNDDDDGVESKDEGSLSSTLLEANRNPFEFPSEKNESLRSPPDGKARSNVVSPARADAVSSEDQRTSLDSSLLKFRFSETRFEQSTTNKEDAIIEKTSSDEKMNAVVVEDAPDKPASTETTVDPVDNRKRDHAQDLAAIKKELANLKAWAKPPPVNSESKKKKKKKRKEKKKKSVQFSYPLVSGTFYRPRTKKEEIDDLYFDEEELDRWALDRVTTVQDQFEVIIAVGNETNGELGHKVAYCNSCLDDCEEKLVKNNDDGASMASF